MPLHFPKRLNVIFILACLLLVTACAGKGNFPAAANSSSIPQSPVAIGDTVDSLSNSILIIFQASNGDYWFGSDTDGAYRYDGATLVHFTTEHGLANNRIRGIQEDKKGKIYLATLGGISKTDGHSFETLTAIPENVPQGNWRLDPGDLWFSIPGKNGDKGPYRYDGEHLYQLTFPKNHLEDDYFSKFPDNAWSPYEVYHIYKDSKGAMWFGTSNLGICRYDGSSWSWLYEDHLTNIPNGGSFGIRSILEDSDGKYWFCNTRYRFSISPGNTVEKGTALIPYTREPGIAGIHPADGTDHIYFMSSIEDDQGDLWMATYGFGIWRYDGKKVTHYSVMEGAKVVTLFSIYQDRQGVLWLGTHEHGAYKWNGKEFVRFQL